MDEFVLYPLGKFLPMEEIKIQKLLYHVNITLNVTIDTLSTSFKKSICTYFPIYLLAVTCTYLIFIKQRHAYRLYLKTEMKFSHIYHGMSVFLCVNMFSSIRIQMPFQDIKHLSICFIKYLLHSKASVFVAETPLRSTMICHA